MSKTKFIGKDFIKEVQNQTAPVRLYEKVHELNDYMTNWFLDNMGWIAKVNMNIIVTATDGDKVHVSTEGNKPIDEILIFSKR